MLTNTDLKSILNFQQKLYQSCSAEAFPNHVLSILPNVVTSDTHFYAQVNYQTATVSSICPPQHLTSPEVNRVGNKYFYEHPLVRHYLKCRDGQAYKISDFISESEFHCLEGVYWQFIHPMGMEDEMIIVLPTSSAPLNCINKRHPTEENDINIGLHRTSRNFSERDRLVLNLIRPHLIQAYLNAQALTQMQQELAQLNRTLEQLGMIVLNRDLKVQRMTCRAGQLLLQYFQVSSLSVNHLPENLWRWVKHQICQLTVTDKIASPCLPLQLEREGKRLVVRLISDSLNEQYLLLLQEELPQSFSAELLGLLGLTKREAEVLFWVAKDKSNREIALILGCSDKTVQKHLEHIYGKFGVQTRAAALVCALEQLGILNR
jgi:DNA-binding CsgD family transcriptional regulator